MMANTKELTSDALRLHFEDNDLLNVKQYLNPSLCAEIVKQLLSRSVDGLPTDGGGVYGLVETEGMLGLTDIADEIACIIGAAATKPLLRPPSLHEVVKYNSDTSLSMHRDNEGDSVTKVIVTLSGSAIFHTAESEFPVCTGDMVMMRGREFVDEPTPLHGTSHNIDRFILLVEPAYAPDNLPAV